MCGIAGFLSHFPINDARARLHAMAQSLHHRGPDAQGLWVEQSSRIGFAHTRLSILDLSQAGAQPMHDRNSGAVITFNGEIYNHEELRKLSRRDSFAGHSDTEVLLYLLVDHPIEKVLPLLRGMYAFAFWDPRNQTLTLARDNFGEKPLHYAMTRSGGFVFGSEIKAIAASALLPMEINPAAFPDFLQSGTISGADCAFKGVTKLKPGCHLKLRIANERIICSPQVSHRQLVMQPDLRNRPIKPDEANSLQAEVLAKLDHSIKAQLSADVPVGAFLSGGVDSSLVVALMRKHKPNDLHTFSVGFDEASYDESDYSSRVADALGTIHHQIKLSPADVIGITESIPAIWDEPFADSSQIPMFKVSQLARETVKVCLSGDGADELFLGYGRYAGFAQWNRLPALPESVSTHLPTWISRALRNSANSTSSGRLAPQLRRLGLAGAMILTHGATQRYRLMIAQWRSSDCILRASATSANGARFSLHGDPDPPTSLDGQDAAALLDLHSYLPDDILVKVDRASMANSLEVRAPFLDWDLAQLAMISPHTAHCSGGTAKFMLKSSVKQQIPGFPADRPKMGFGVPLDTWLRTILKAWAERQLFDASHQAQEHLNMAFVQQLWKAQQQGSNIGGVLWPILMLTQWLNSFESGIGSQTSSFARTPDIATAPQPEAY